VDFHSTGREVLANYRCTPYPVALDDWMREKAIELGEFADYVYRQPSAEGELFTHYSECGGQPFLSVSWCLRTGNRAGGGVGRCCSVDCRLTRGGG
jgi:hypothetical protein